MLIYTVLVHCLMCYDLKLLLRLQLRQRIEGKLRGLVEVVKRKEVPPR